LDRRKAQLGGMGLRGNLQSFLRARDSDRGSSKMWKQKEEQEADEQMGVIFKKKQQKSRGRRIL